MTHLIRLSSACGTFKYYNSAGVLKAIELMLEMTIDRLWFVFEAMIPCG